MLFRLTKNRAFANVASHLRVIVIVASACVAATSPVPGGGRCDDGCRGAVETDPRELARSWDALYAHFRKYAGHCEDGDAGETSSEAVALAFGRWSMLPKLKKLIDGDATFGDWVLMHLDDQTGPEPLSQIYENATKACPRRCKRLCARIAERAKDVARALESGAAESK
jgi:hypothetical protein